MISEQINLCDVVIFIFFVCIHNSLLGIKLCSQLLSVCKRFERIKKRGTNESETEKCGKLTFATPPLKCFEMKHLQRTLTQERRRAHTLKCEAKTAEHTIISFFFGWRKIKIKQERKKVGNSIKQTANTREKKIAC